MKANVEIVAAVYTNTHTIFLEDNIASFLCSKISFILRKIINRVKFVYLFELRFVV